MATHKATLVQKIKAKYASNGKFDPLIESEVDNFLAKSTITQENLLLLDQRIRNLLLVPKPAQNKPSPTKEKPCEQKKLDAWGALAKHNANLHMKHQQEYNNYLGSMKKTVKEELDKQVAEKKKIQAEQARKQKEIEFTELRKAMEKEKAEIEKEKLKNQQVSNELRKSCKEFEAKKPRRKPKEVEQLVWLEQELVKEKQLDVQNRITARKVFEDIIKNELEAKKVKEIERIKEIELERKAALEQEMQLKREQQHKEYMQKKHAEYLNFLEAAKEKTMSTLSKTQRENSIENKEWDERRLARQIKLEEEKAKYVKEMEKETKKELDKIIQEKQKRRQEEKEYDRKIIEEANRKHEKETMEEKERLEKERQIRVAHQKEVKRQMEEKLERKIEENDKGMLISKRLIQQAMETLN